MTKTLIIGGYGPGISHAVAKRFGREGYALALIARHEDKLTAAVDELGRANIVARAFPGDLGDPAGVQRLVNDIRTSLGPIAILHWNAYSVDAGDLTTSEPEELRRVFDVGVIGCVAAMQAALPDLKANQGAVLVTGGGYASFDEQIDTMLVDFNSMGLGLMKAAQRKLVGILNKRLARAGVFAGQVLVLGTVKGTPFHSGEGGIEPGAVADQFWSLFTARQGATAICR
jgi:NAD(P)-dependent dehydrogenase (short-subunit alcohol dehydrogenase family)